MGNSKKRVVVIGGGTGTYTILQGLKAYTDTLHITAIVTMADSGGSTGRLRDEFGQLPVGDVRMALAALATDVDAHADLLRELFLYRFDKGEGLSGHNFGNLLLTALTDILGNTSVAIETAGQILRVKGTVIPVTTDDVHLAATYNTGETVVGEHQIDVPSPQAHLNRITNLSVTPHATINPKAQAAILAADLIVLGPGDLYTSILANCVVGGVREAIAGSNATIVYVCNLMSRGGQTIGMHAAEYLSEIEKYLGVKPAYMIYNNAPFQESLLEKYVAEGNHVVENNCADDVCQVLSDDVVSTQSYVSVSGDTIQRSLIRHDAAKLASRIMSLIK
jgi:uncharacterized cofD-like protein